MSPRCKLIFISSRGGPQSGGLKSTNIESNQQGPGSIPAASQSRLRRAPTSYSVVGGTGILSMTRSAQPPTSLIIHRRWNPPTCITSQSLPSSMYRQKVTHSGRNASPGCGVTLRNPRWIETADLLSWGSASRLWRCGHVLHSCRLSPPSVPEPAVAHPAGRKERHLALVDSKVLPVGMSFDRDIRGFGSECRSCSLPPGGDVEQ